MDYMTTNNTNETIKELERRNEELEAQVKEMKTNRSWDWENAHKNDWREIKEMGEL